MRADPYKSAGRPNPDVPFPVLGHRQGPRVIERVRHTLPCEPGSVPARDTVVSTDPQLTIARCQETVDLSVGQPRPHSGDLARTQGKEPRIPRPNPDFPVRCL